MCVELELEKELQFGRHVRLSNVARLGSAQCAARLLRCCCWLHRRGGISNLYWGCPVPLPPCYSCSSSSLLLLLCCFFVVCLQLPLLLMLALIFTAAATKYFPLIAHTLTHAHTHTAAHCSVQQQQEQQQQLRRSTRDKLALCFALRFRFRFALRSALRPVTLRFALRCVAAVSLSRRPPTCRVSAQLNIRTELCLACTRRKLSRLSLVRVPARERERARAQPIECVRALE